MKFLRLETADGVAALTLNRPQKLNSLSLELMDELAQAVEELSASDARVVILTGAGRAFCTGIDVNLLASIGQGLSWQELEEVIVKWQNTLNALENLPQITIAVINGVALGGAIELALCCDFRFASSKASFGMPEVRLGILPDLGGIPRLVRSVGSARTKEIILRGRNFSAMEALRLGLVNRVAEPGDIMGQARAWAEFFGQTPANALTRAKHLINAAPDQSLGESLRAALEANLALFQSPDFQSALLAAQQEPETST